MLPFDRFAFTVGAFLVGLGVAVGAFGAHGLPKFLSAKVMDEEKIELRLEQCETAVKYQVYHGLAMFVLGLFGCVNRPGFFKFAFGFFLVGVVLFSGGIYGIVFFDAPTHYVVPVGGLGFIAGWCSLVLAGLLGRVG